MFLRSAALAASLFAFAPVVAAAPVHDGQWRVQLVTQSGFCDVYQWNIGVQGGRITEIGAPGATANGRIEPNGRVNVRLARGDDVMSVMGVLQARAGGGEWVLPNRSCSGSWSAEKIA